MSDKITNSQHAKTKQELFRYFGDPDSLPYKELVAGYKEGMNEGSGISFKVQADQFGNVDINTPEFRDWIGKKSVGALIFGLSRFLNAAYQEKS